MKKTNIETVETMTIEEKLAALNKAVEEKASDEIISDLVVSINNALKERNKDNVAERIGALAAMARDNRAIFWATFLENPYATVQRLSSNKDTNGYVLNDGRRRIRFEQVDTAYGDRYDGETIARSKRYVGMIARFTHNLYRAECKELSEGGAAVVHVNFNGKAEAKTAEYDFSGYSNGALQSQLDAIANVILPDNMGIHLVKADVRYVRTAFAQVKEGKVKTMDEKTVSNLIFDAIAVRAEGKTYIVESRAKCHKDGNKTKKSERTEKQEEIMSKVPDRPEAAATLSKRAEEKAS